MSGKSDAYYLYRTKPDDDMDVYDRVPIYPASLAQLFGTRVRHDYHREIAWSIDYRGDNDDVPTLVYTGAGYTLIKRVFAKMFPNGSVAFRGYKLYRDTYVYPRQRKAWWRVAVELKELNTDIMTIDSIGLVIQAMIKKECWCNIEFMKLDKFLNI